MSLTDDELKSWIKQYQNLEERLEILFKKKERTTLASEESDELERNCEQREETYQKLHDGLFKLALHQIIHLEIEEHNRYALAATIIKKTVDSYEEKHETKVTTWLSNQATYEINEWLREKGIVSNHLTANSLQEIQQTLKNNKISKDTRETLLQALSRLQNRTYESEKSLKDALSKEIGAPLVGKFLQFVLLGIAQNTIAAPYKHIAEITDEDEKIFRQALLDHAEREYATEKEFRNMLRTAIGRKRYNRFFKHFPLGMLRDDLPGAIDQISGMSTHDKETLHHAFKALEAKALKRGEPIKKDTDFKASLKKEIGQSLADQFFKLIASHTSVSNQNYSANYYSVPENSSSKSPWPPLKKRGNSTENFSETPYKTDADVQSPFINMDFRDPEERMDVFLTYQQLPDALQAKVINKIEELDNVAPSDLHNHLFEVPDQVIEFYFFYIRVTCLLHCKEYISGQLHENKRIALEMMLDGKKNVEIAAKVQAPHNTISDWRKDLRNRVQRCLQTKFPYIEWI